MNGVRISTCLALSAMLTNSILVAQSGESSCTFKPNFSLGVGMLSFYGDIGQDQSSYSPLLANPAFAFRAAAPLAKGLEMGIAVLHGNMAVNERNLLRNLNFSSRITTAGLQLTYDFEQFFKKDHIFSPFISAGIESVFFKSSTDVMDSEGRTYNYWTDGTIRDIAQNAPDAENAQLIERDYTYESNIRDLNVDGFGAFNTQAWSVPIGIGAKMLVTDALDVRLSGTMHYSFTDLIDGVTNASLGDRVGDTKKDRFLYLGMSLGYAIGGNKKKQDDWTMSAPDMDKVVLDADQDMDGVKDILDLCPNTPAGVKTTANGCPVDTDGDRVPDHIDKEPNTAKGAPVTADGVTLTDADFLKVEQVFGDSIGAKVIRTTK